MFNKVGIKKSRSKMVMSTCFITPKKVDMHGGTLPRARRPRARARRARVPSGPLSRDTITSFLRMKEMCQNNLKRLKYIFIIPGPKAITEVNRILSHYDTGQLQTPLLR